MSIRSCLTVGFTVLLLLCIFVGCRVFAIGAFIAVQSISTDDYFKADCLNAVNIGTSKPSTQAMLVVLYVAVGWDFLVVCCWAVLKFEGDFDEEMTEEECIHLYSFVMCFLQLTEILFCFAILIHANVYIDGLKAEFINKSLFDCSEFADFKKARVWCIAGVWFFAFVIAALLVFLYSNKKAIKRELRATPLRAWFEPEVPSNELATPLIATVTVSDKDNVLYFELSGSVFGQTALCSDFQCTCNERENPMFYGQGYIYISPEVVEFRRDCLSLQEFEQKLVSLRDALGTNTMFVNIGQPIIMCREAAESRNLNLEIAAKDAKMWWFLQKVPLRTTPLNEDSIQIPLQQQIELTVSNKDNVVVLDELFAEFECKDDEFISPYIYISCDQTISDEKNDEKTMDPSCNIIDCQSAERISYTLNNDDRDIDIKSVLNDFNHLLFCHQDDFEAIYNKVVLDGDGCSVNECSMIRRRNMSAPYTNNVTGDSIKDVVQQNVLDRIHVYYFHSFDIGYRFKRNDGERLLIQEMKGQNESVSNNHISRRNNRYSTNTEYLKKKPNEKITDIESKINQFSEDEQISDIKDKLCQSNEIYDEGIRYFYWDYYAKKMDEEDPILIRGELIEGYKFVHSANSGYSVNEWYIKKKYDNLEEELLNNTISTVSKTVFRGLLAEAGIHHKTQYAKGITTIDTEFVDVTQRLEMFGMEKGAYIDKKHLLAMMVYCACDVLQSKFSETFRRRKGESDESLKTRHANYANFGRLLREFVECFGQNGIGNKQVGTTYLYHGVSEEIQFGSIKIRMKGPLSATQQIGVATTFADAYGLVLQFTLSKNWIYGTNDANYYDPISNQCAFVDCFWLSPFPEEQERFFIGGYSHFYVESILSMPSGDNFELFIQAIRIICETMIDSEKWFLSIPLPDRCKKVVSQVAFRLLSHALHKQYPDNAEYHSFKSPKYVEQLFHNFRVNVEGIVFFRCPEYDYRIEFSYKKMKKMCHALLFYDCGVVQWHVVSTLFPSAKVLCIDDDWPKDDQNLRLIENEEFWKTLFLFLEGRTLPTIVIKLRSPTARKMAPQIVEKYLDLSANWIEDDIGWTVFASDDCGVITIKHDETCDNAPAKSKTTRKDTKKYQLYHTINAYDEEEDAAIIKILWS